MRNKKRSKLFRTLIILLVIILLATISSSANYFESLSYKNLMQAVELENLKELTIPTGNAADTAGFTTLNPAGAGYNKVAENQYLMLFLDENLQGIKLYDKSSKKLWSSLMQGKGLTSTDLSENFYNSMNSMLTFQYIDLFNTSAVEQSAYSSTQPCKSASEPITNGVRVTYNFYKLNITISVEFTIEGDRLAVTVPDNLIKENDDENGVNSVNTTKKQLQDYIDQIKSVEKAAQKVAKGTDYTDGMRKVIDLTVTNNDQILDTLEQQAETGDYISQQLENISDNVNTLLSITTNSASLQKSLTELVPVVEKMGKLADALSQSRSTGITSLQVIPYFGAQRSDTNGYVFYPDENGAISYFNKKHSAMSGVYEQDVYSQHNTSQMVNINSGNNISIGSSDNSDYTAPSMMPVFGIKAGKSAFVAIIDKGDTDSAIAYNPCQPNMDCGNVYAQYYLRQQTTYVSGTGAQNDVFDNQRTNLNWRTYYMFLNGDDANYSGMAVAYRNYLEKKGLLTRSKEMNGAMPVGLEYFMGLESSHQSLLRDYTTMTRYSDILSNVKSMKNAGIKNLMINITDWTENNGVKEPDTWKPAAETGGADGLKKLSSFITQNNFLISLTKQMVWAQKKDVSSAFTNTVAVRNKSQLIFETDGWNLLNPLYIYNSYASKNLDIPKQYGVNGLTLGYAGNMLYFDYNKNGKVSRSNTARLFGKLENTVQSRLGYAVGFEDNAYMFASLDWDMYLSAEDNSFLYSDENVPFYQIVVHGSIPYTGDAFNLLYDQTEQRLKAIEYGYLPFYYLTEESPLLMRDVGYNDFSSSQASTTLPDIIKTYNAYQKDFSEIWNKQIEKHTRISDTVSRTDYDGGTRVYVNYGDKAAVMGNVRIEAKSYAVVKP